MPAPCERARQLAWRLRPAPSNTRQHLHQSFIEILCKSSQFNYTTWTLLEVLPLETYSGDPSCVEQNGPSLFRKFGSRKLAKGVRRAAERRTKLSIEPLEARNLLTVATFRFGDAGYVGQQDTVIFSQDRNTNFGTEGHISADQQDFNNVRQGLIKFEDIFGNGPGQIPFGATINSAELDVFVQDDSNAGDANEPVSHAHRLGRVGRDLE